MFFRSRARLGVTAQMTSFTEPDVAGAPLRRFTDPGYVPQAQTLGELRARIDTLDAQIVGLLAERALCVRGATRFKRDAYQVSAPQRQAQVFAKVRALAQPHEEKFPGLADIVESTYRTLVAGFIAGEDHLFHSTERIPTQ